MTKPPLQDGFDHGEYDIPDVLRNVAQEWRGWKPVEGATVAKCYLEVNVHVHLRFRWRSDEWQHESISPEPHTCDYHAILERAFESEPGDLASSVGVVNNGVVNTANIRRGLQQGLMFVWLVEPVEHEQGVQIRKIRSVVRLQSLESIDHFRAGPAKSAECP